MRGAALISVLIHMMVGISTHAPHARRGVARYMLKKLKGDFYSRASCEARPVPQVNVPLNLDFYSRASCEARLKFNAEQAAIDNFYSRASCEARQISDF